MAIEKVAVIGAGVMGAGIAAQIANAGVPVVLLDIVPDGANDRSAVAKGAIAKLQKAKPAPLMHKRNVRLIQPGNIEDDLGLLDECDWIVEAVVERLDIKQSLYEKIDAHRRADAIVSSNTSTIPLAKLVEAMPASMRAHFVISHFFNPPRYMRLLELVSSTETSPGAVSQVADFCDRKLGKGVVCCHDEPGFIANRIGTYWIQNAMGAAFDLNLPIEEADAISGEPMGIPRTGVFGLMDLVGLDLMPHVQASLKANLATDDPVAQGAAMPPLIEKMIADGYTGKKGKGGFYRTRRDGSDPVREAIDLTSGDYRKRRKAKPSALSAAKKGGLRALLSHDSDGGQFAARTLLPTLAYSATLVPAIASSPADVDAGMRLGYSWKKGPFELIDELGADWLIERMEANGESVPPMLEHARGRTFYRVENGTLQCLNVEGEYTDIPRADGVLTLTDVKRAGPRVAGNSAASLWDLGDGVLCLEFHTKMNAIDAGILSMVGKAIKTVSASYKALVIHNEADNFSVGANIGLLLFAANMAAYEEIGTMIEQGQKAFLALKYAPFPVVGAPSGMALGGGCEVLLHCDAVQAHAETYMGLVEVGVGLVPGWGGCKELVTRWLANKKRPGGPMPGLVKAFETISTAKVATSAAEAYDSLFLRSSDGVSMNRDRVLADAKAKALELAEGYVPPEPPVVRLPGPTAKCAMELAVEGLQKAGKATQHDGVVARAVATVVSGGDTDMLDEMDEAALCKLERDAFVKLSRHPGTLARVEHMLKTGKPLRN